VRLLPLHLIALVAAANVSSAGSTPPPIFYPVLPEPEFKYVPGEGRTISERELGSLSAQVQSAASALGIAPSRANEILTPRSQSNIESGGRSYRRIEMDVFVPHSCGQLVYVWVPREAGDTLVFSTSEACYLE
jgi:hypothetical protein